MKQGNLIAGLLAPFLLCATQVYSLELKKSSYFRTIDGETFSLGMRSTGSFFGVDGNAGFGFGG